MISAARIEHAHRFAAGERVQFKNPNAEITANVAPNPGKPKAIKPAGAVSNDPKRAERLKREQDLVAEMRRKKEAEDGGVLLAL